MWGPIEPGVETDTAGDLTVDLGVADQTIAIEQATEVDTAADLTVRLTVPIEQATETDSAEDLAVRLTVPIEQAFESDVAEELTVETTGPLTFPIEQAVEVDEAAELGVMQTRVVAAGDRMAHERIVTHHERTGTAQVRVRVAGQWRRRRNVALDDEEVLALL